MNDAFFHPLDGLVATSPHTYSCPEFSDEDWLLMGVQRVLERAESGRAFLQEHGPRFEYQPTRSNYFVAQNSPRRLDLVRDVNRRLLSAAVLPDHLAQLPELKRYQCFALDGHWHQAATHDPRHDGTKMAVGHFYSLDLRGHQLRHLTVGEGLHEHDMSVLKRIKPSGLRHDVPKGQRVLIVYDKAGIDFAYWKRCQRECAVYFISRVKEGMVYDWLADRPVDPHDPRQRGVTADRHLMTRESHPMRIIAYTDPASGQAYEFLTNEMDLPAGVIAELYRRRWDVEKVFDQIKNKLGEKKAWGTSLTAKATQGQLVALTHNLLLRYEARLEREHGVNNAAEDQRRQKRLQELKQAARQTGSPLTTLRTGLRRATQRSVKFLRWLRQALRENLAETAAVPRLSQLYASL
ncbi:MAG: transposase [Proteobacteria bacterium]|nr:transposase [Pseudomonadota bacterium]